MAPHPESIDELFTRFLDRMDADPSASFDEWVVHHPDEETALREAWSDWRRAEAALDGPSTGSAPPAPRPGLTVGEFTLVRELGGGGQAVVWEADQAGLRRRVALKLLRPDRVSARHLALFRREARAGARLRDEGIVAVYDFGQEGEVSWIAQELVPGGRTLRDRIDEVRRTGVATGAWYREVAEIVRRIAKALEVAHGAGIVHRDVKPQNVLLTPDGWPKVGDFGMARLEDSAALSQSGQLVGTYLYMSPEQVAARRSGIDHRTDVFSLGVVLYELLTLSRPFEGDTAHQICSQILHRDPPEPRVLRSQMPRELSVICAKALEKDRERRYADMRALGEDLERYLSDRPILARSPSRFERAVKWARRHPTRSTAGVVGAISLIVITMLLSRYIEKSGELSLANEDLLAERDRLAGVVEFQEGLFEELSPEDFGEQLRRAAVDSLQRHHVVDGSSEEERAAGLAELQEVLSPVNFTSLGVTAIGDGVLEPARGRIHERFDEDPLTSASLQESLALAFAAIGRLEPALELLLSCLEVRRELLDRDHADRLAAECLVGRQLARMGRYEEAIPYSAEALRGRRAVLGGDHGDTLESIADLGGVYLVAGRLDEAEPLLREAVARSTRSLGERHHDTLEHVNNLVGLFYQTGRHEEALAQLQRMLRILREDLGEDDPQLLLAINNTGYLLQELRRYDEALPYYEEVLERRRRILGDDAPDTLVSLNNLGNLLTYLDRKQEALRYLELVYEQRVEVLGHDHRHTLNSQNNLAILLGELGQHAEEERILREVLAKRREALGPGHVDVVESLENIGFALIRQERWRAALEQYEEARAEWIRLHGEGFERTLICDLNKGRILVELGRTANAVAALEPAVEHAETTLGPGHGLRGALAETLARCYDDLEEQVPGEGHAERAAELRARFGDGQPGE